MIHYLIGEKANAIDLFKVYKMEIGKQPEEIKVVCSYCEVTFLTNMMKLFSIEAVL